MNFNQEIFNTLIPLLHDKGLSKSLFTEHNGGLDFYKSDGENDHRLTLDLVVEKRGFGNIYGRISFKTVIDILSKFEGLRPKVYEAVVVNYDLLSRKDYWFGVFKKLGGYSLNNKRDVEEFKLELLNHIECDVLPFFEKYPDVQSVNDKMINKLPQTEYSNYIPGETNFKVLIIMKLCKNSKYEEFKSWALGAYRKGVELDAATYQEEYDALVRLVDYLDNKVD